MSAEAVLQNIRTRRVTRYYTDQPVPREHLMAVLEAGRWAPSGGNRRLHRFIVVQDPVTIRLLNAVTPGMLGVPTALVVICIDWAKVAQIGCKPHHLGVYIDVGTGAENMLLSAHALGLGAGPVTSFSKAGVSMILNLPEWLTPEMMVCLGYPAPHQPFGRTLPRRSTRLDDLVCWEGFPGHS
ncbi:MAG: nitroreductase family protein [Armatimonadetes bacterium]|nr:nitroreductase family protein [Armatimonadota bacterium]